MLAHCIVQLSVFMACCLAAVCNISVSAVMWQNIYVAVHLYHSVVQDVTILVLLPGLCRSTTLSMELHLSTCVHEQLGWYIRVLVLRLY